MNQGEHGNRRAKADFALERDKYTVQAMTVPKEKWKLGFHAKVSTCR